jgi:hypothetical protein
MLYLTVFTISLLCLAFNSTRLAGVIALFLLAYFNPTLLMVLLVVSGIDFFFIKLK